MSALTHDATNIRPRTTAAGPGPTGSWAADASTVVESASTPTDRDERANRNAVAVIGCWQLALAVATIVVTLLWWPAAEQAAETPVDLGWLPLTATTGMLLLGMIGGVAGSLVHTIAIFSSRVGRSTLERSYLWWYVLRPFGAALLALIFVAALSSGLVAIGADSGETFAFVAGGLAGLFTDAVLQRLRHVLGATSTEKQASEQAVPLEPVATVSGD